MKPVEIRFYDIKDGIIRYDLFDMQYQHLTEQPLTANEIINSDLWIVKSYHQPLRKDVPQETVELRTTIEQMKALTKVREEWIDESYSTPDSARRKELGELENKAECDLNVYRLECFIATVANFGITPSEYAKLVNA